LFEHCPQKLRRVFDATNAVNSILWHEIGDRERIQRVGDRHVEFPADGLRLKTRVVLYRRDYEMPKDPAQQIKFRTRPHGRSDLSLPLEFSTYDIRLETDDAE
jgi:hypothetical protein